MSNASKRKLVKLMERLKRPEYFAAQIQRTKKGLDSDAQATEEAARAIEREEARRLAILERQQAIEARRQARLASFLETERLRQTPGGEAVPEGDIGEPVNILSATDVCASRVQAESAVEEGDIIETGDLDPYED